MEIESQVHQPTTTNIGGKPNTSRAQNLFLSLNLFLLVVGCGGMPLLLRLYVSHGGHLLFFSTFLQTAGFPLLLPPLLLSPCLRRHHRNKPKFCFSTIMTTALLLSCAVLGVLTAAVNFCYAYGLFHVPVSTSSLLLSTQLCFAAAFAFLIVKQRFTPFSINAVVLLTMGAVVLGVNAGGDRPEGERSGKYFLGFSMTIGAAVLDGLLPTLAELMFMKLKRELTYLGVVETQVVIGFVATVCCVVGMLVNGEFQAISREAKECGLGEANYYLVILSFAVVMQCFFLGRVGVVFFSSALLNGIVVDVLLPVTVVLAVVIFHEPFTSNKAVAIVLSLWGFMSYIYGERRI